MVIDYIGVPCFSILKLLKKVMSLSLWKLAHDI